MRVGEKKVVERERERGAEEWRGGDDLPEEAEFMQQWGRLARLS